MAYHGVMIPVQIAAQNVDAWVRSAVSASDVDNGNIVILSGKSATSGESEAWTAIVPSTGNGLTDVWMAYEPEVVWTGSYRGLDPDVRNFYNAATRMFSIFKPQIGDLVMLTADNLVTGTGAALGSFAIATNSTGGLKLVWTSGWTSSTHVFALKCVEITYISLATGAIDDQRETAYLFEVVHL